MNKANTLKNIPTTKICPKCGDEHLLLLRSLNLKICVVCNTKIPWELDKDQKPLVKHQR